MSFRIACRVFSFSLLPALLILAEPTSTPDPPPTTIPMMGVGGRMYPVSKVNKEFEKAKKSYGVEPSTHQVRSAKALGAKLVKGAVVRQSAGQAIVQSDQGMIAIIFRKENAVATGSEGTWMIKARHARVQERMADGKRVSLDLYDDVTLSSSEFVQTLNSGIAMGVDIKPAAKKMDGTGGRMNRMPSQWERKTIKVNKK